jgi:hypothetical protein
MTTERGLARGLKFACGILFFVFCGLSFASLEWLWVAMAAEAATFFAFILERDCKWADILNTNKVKRKGE